VQAVQGHSAPLCVSLYEYHEGDTSSEAFIFRFNLQGSMCYHNNISVWFPRKQTDKLIDK